MPFGLKNTGTTYQRMIQTCLATQIGKTVEAYVDDVVVKTKHVETLVDDLSLTFDNLRAFDIKMNPEKCVFGIPAGKLLGFIVSGRGIEANPAKIRALSQLDIPKDLKKNTKIDWMRGGPKPLHLPFGRKSITPLSPPQAVEGQSLFSQTGDEVT